MAEYAPEAITAAWELIHDAIPSAQLSGIKGDAAHTYGYHRGRDFVSDPATDYSVQKPDDKLGNGQACSALDVSFSDADMAKVTQRLIDATQAGDPALKGLRSFIGTTNGRDVIGMDVPGRYYITSDDTHLWHEHYSGTRKYADDMAAWADIAAVSTGSTQTGSDDVPTYLHIGHTKAQRIDPGKWTWLLWDTAWSDPDDCIDAGKAGIHHVERRFMALTLSVNCKSADPDRPLAGTIRTKFGQLTHDPDNPDPLDVDTDPLEHPVTSGATDLVDARPALYVQAGNYLVAGIYADQPMSIDRAKLVAGYW